MAQQIGVKPSTVSYWFHHDVRFKAVLEREQQQALTEAKNALIGGVVSAAQEVARLANKADLEVVRLQAAKYLLDRLISLTSPVPAENELTEALVLVKRLYGNPH